MFKEFCQFYKPYKTILISVLLASCLEAGMDLIFPALVRRIMNVELPAKNTDELFFWLEMMLALYLVNFAVMYGMTYYGHFMSALIQNDMRRKLFSHMQYLSFRFYDNNKTGQLLNRIMSDIAEVSELSFKGPSDILICSITMTGTIIIMFYMNWRLAAVIAFLLIFKSVHTVYINRKMKAAFRASRQKSGELASHTEEALSGIRVMKAFATEPEELDRFMVASNAVLETRRKSFNILSYFHGSINFFTNFINILLMGIGGYFIAHDQMQLSDLVAFFLYVNLFMRPLLRLTVFTEMYQRAMAGYQRYHELVHEPLEIEDMPGAVEANDIQGEIEFKNVTFSYLEGKPIVQNLNLTIKPGEKVAFVGETGAGKTTIANMLLRFYEPEAGTIYLDGRDIRNYTQSSLRKNIGLVQQDVFLFSESVSFNIAYAKFSASEEEIASAARLAAANNFIEALPNGYATPIGERGVKLSGGQKQRIAIARAFLKNPPVLVLDEATSSLDTKTEKQIQGALDELAKKRTTIIIAHRLSTIINADKIVVLKDGKVVEQGKHDELMMLNGVYKKLYELSEA
ncbi:MAG: ABC transporter ATP-binding protein [Phascolarctobacterium sp.]|nr:ABC transporter ATP-binding protein [Phascolarctobacterium sp.]